MLQIILTGWALAGLDMFTFEVGEVQGTIKSPDITLTHAQASLECYLEGGIAGSRTYHPREDLETTLTPLPEEGMYAVHVASGSLWDWTLVTDLIACGYALRLKGKDHKGGRRRVGKFTLAGKTAWFMGEKALHEILTDKNLNEKISESKLKPLEVGVSPFMHTIARVAE